MDIETRKKVAASLRSAAAKLQGASGGVTVKSLEWLQVLFNSGWTVTASRRADGNFVVVVTDPSKRPHYTLDGFKRADPATFVGPTLDEALLRAVRG